MRTAILMLCAVASVARSEPIPPASLNPRGSEIFRALLKHQGLQPVDPNDPHGTLSTILIVFGSLPSERSTRDRLAQYSRDCLEHGNPVFFASDRQADLSGFLHEPKSKLQIDGQPVFDGTPGNSLNNESDLPFLRFVPDASNELDLYQLSLLKRVATNRPSFITHAPDTPFQSLARFSDQSTAFGITRQTRGHALILSDAGVLSNQMLVAEGTDNFEFAIHLTAFLASGPNRQSRRTHCLFWEGESFRNNFDSVPLTVPPPDLRPSWTEVQKLLAEKAEQKLVEMQDRDFPNSTLSRNRSFLRVMRPLAVVAAILAVILLLRHIRGQRTDTEMTPATTPTGEAANPFADLTSIVGDRLRAQFVAWEAPARVKPRVAVQGSWLYRYRMRKSVNELSALAYGAPQRVPSRQLKAIEAAISEIDDAYRAGRLHFPRVERPS